MPDHYNNFYNHHNYDRPGYTGQGGTNGNVNTNTTSSDGVFETDSLALVGVQSKVINRTFGRKGDYIELHIYNVAMELLHTNHNFTDYTLPTGESGNITGNIQINPHQILNNLGYTTGRYLLKLNILRNKIFDTVEQPFQIIEVSSKKREIRTICNTPNTTLEPAVNEFIADLSSATYFREFSINFGRDVIIPCINVMLNRNTRSKYQTLFRT